MKKFLLENNISASQFEEQLKNNELEKFYLIILMVD